VINVPLKYDYYNCSRLALLGLRVHNL